MSSTVSSDGKHHVLMIYLIDEDGVYGGGYYESFWSMMGGVQGKSREETIECGYESLESFIADESAAPFDRKNIKGSVVFDIVECYTMEELDEANKLHYQGANYHDISKAVLQ